MTTIIRTFAVFVVVLTLGASLAAQQPPPQTRDHDHDHDHSHDHDWESLLRPSTRLPTDYTIKAEIQPDSSILRFTMELIYQHRRPDTVPALTWRLPAGTHLGPRHIAADSLSARFYLDSISHRAVPLEPSQIEFIDSIHLRTALHAPIVPAQITSLFMSGELDLNSHSESDILFLSEWFPRILDPTSYPGDPDSSTNDVLLASYPLAPAQIETIVSIDTAYHLAYPGRLLNEKEHFGFLPQTHHGQDSVFYDITDGRFLDFGTYSYDPVFEGGIKSYYLMDRHTSNLPLAMASAWRTDRILADSLTIDLYYPTVRDNSTCSTLTDIIRQAARWMSQTVGRPKARRLALVFTDTHQQVATSNLALSVISDSDAVNRVSAIRALTKIWLPAIWASDHALYREFKKGLVSFLTYHMAHDDHSGLSTADLRDWEIARLNTQETIDTTLQRRTMRLYPARLFEIEQSLGGAAFFAKLAEWLGGRDHSLRDPAVLFQSLVPDRHAYSNWTHWSRTPIAIDSAAVQRTKSGTYRITIYLDTNHQPFAFPLEVLVAWAGGHRFVTAEVSNPHNPVAEIENEFPRRPHTVVLDPNRKLNDTDRTDNDYRLIYTRNRIPSPKDQLFHGFTPLPF